MPHPFDLAASLESGQAHRWRKEEDWYSGVVRGNFVKMRQSEQGVEFCSAPWPESALVPLLQSYFRLDDDLGEIYAEINRDGRVAEMVARYPGLRILRQEPWECLVAFICTQGDRVSKVAEVLDTLAKAHSSPAHLEGWTFYRCPSWKVLAKEEALETAGSRFEHGPLIHEVARDISTGFLDFELLAKHPHEKVQRRLVGDYKGIRDKIADCVCLFSLGKSEAFPIDTHVRTCLEEHYGDVFTPKYKSQDARDGEYRRWARDRFGPNAGYASQLLFMSEFVKQ